MPRATRWAFTPRQLGLCVLAGGLIAVGGLLAVTGAREARIAVGWVQHTFRVLMAIDQLRTALIDAETGYRGFLLTGRDDYLEPYESGRARVEPAVGALRKLDADDPVAREQMARLEPMIDTKLETMALAIERYRSQGSTAAAAVVDTDIGKQTMDEIRALLDALRSHTSELLAERLKERDYQIRRTFYSTLALTALSLAIFAVVVASLNRTLRRQIAAERAVLEGQERLRVTLRSIGDAVIATDVAGRVVFLNPVAQALTGWRESDAIGVPLGDVFRIVNEYSRETVESPVAKVLREGQIVGLANHTILLARDGAEHPIDDSGAPIRDAGGELMGVVLVFRDVTARRASESARAELLRAQSERDAAEAANRARDEFFAVVSHELRSPLAAASSWIEVLGGGALSPAEQSRAIQTIGRNLRLQSLLISDLLDVSRIVAGKLTIERVPLDVGTVVEAVVGDYQHVADGRELTLHFERGPERRALLDRARFEQVLSNLLSNAIRFTPRGGRIEIGLDARGDQLELAVRDDGVGIAPHLLSQVFDRFRQGGDPAAREYGGLGLGLTIAKYLVEQHGGTITAESDGVGRGATFRIRMPAYTGDAQSPVPQPARGASSRGVLDGVDVLLVEDHEDSRDALQLLLQNRGAAVRVASTAAEALALYQAQRPAIVISDLGLPVQSGIDLIQHIRREEAAQGVHTPAIAASGFVGGGHSQQALQAGFDAQLAKPLDFATLLQTMQELLARKSG